MISCHRLDSALPLTRFVRALILSMRILSSAPVVKMEVQQPGAKSSLRTFSFGFQYTTPVVLVMCRSSVAHRVNVGQSVTSALLCIYGTYGQRTM